MGARLIDGKWWIDFRHKGRRYRQLAPLNTKRSAVDEERHQLDRLARGLPVGREEVRVNSETCAEYFGRWVDVYVVNNKQSEADSKRSIIRLHLAPFFGAEPLTVVNWARRIAEFKAAQMQVKGLDPKTVNNHLTVLRKALGTAKEWGLLPEVPKVQWLKVAAPSFDFFTAEEGSRLMAAAAQPAKYRPLEIGHEQAAVMVTTALRAGLRRGELLALRWADVDFGNGKLLVRQSDYLGTLTTPKGGRSREVPLSPTLTAALRGHRHLRGEYVFCRQDGRRLTRDAIKHVVPSACRRAGLRELQWHALRHSFASQLVMAGVPLKVVQELLGHADIKMTMRYAHLSPATLVDAITRLDEESGPGQQVGSKLKVLNFSAVK
jgi:integrase